MTLLILRGPILSPDTLLEEDVKRIIGQFNKAE
jgi:hypothetical protein